MLNFYDIFTDLGIKKEDSLLAHADLSFLKEKGTSLFDSYDYFYSEVIKKLRYKNIIFPSFTFSFCKKKTFDIKKTISETGMFPNFLLKKNDTIRTNHPIFSCVLYGKDSKELASNLSLDAFGKESIFDKLYNTPSSKILFINCSFMRCTFCHYVEQKLDVKYRYIKKFMGTVVDGTEKFNKTYTYFVRPLDNSVQYDLIPLENRLIKSKFLKKINVKGISFSVISIKDFVRETKNILKKDSLFLLKKNKF